MIVLMWLVFAFIVAILANNRGRHPLLWFLLSIVLSPLIAGIALLCMSNIKAEQEAERRHKELLEATKQTK
ncbi:hypothetical protein ACEUAW_17245 [Aeromonas veronii]